MKIIEDNKDSLTKLALTWVNDYDLGRHSRALFNNDPEINRDFPNDHDLGVFVRKKLIEIFSKII